MEAPASARLVHSFDTRLHQILCGLRGFEHRSTKHDRAVTCPACVKIIGARAVNGTSGSDLAPGLAVAGGEHHS
jgi:hypothetical protein